jgi:hypothetical protein
MAAPILLQPGAYLDIPEFGLRSCPGKRFRVKGPPSRGLFDVLVGGTHRDGGDWYDMKHFGRMTLGEIVSDWTHHPDLDMPKGLDADWVLAWQTIMEHLPRVTPHPDCAGDPELARSCGCAVTDCYMGGCRAFYSPAEWRERNEKFGTGGCLIVCYDGGELRRHMTLDSEDYKAVDAMQAALGAVGFYAEECTGWYGAIYRKGAS